MVVHFICRGNTFRSVMAEAYLKSLRIRGVDVISSGTSAARDRAKNIPNFQRTLALLETHGIKQFAKPAHGEQLPAGAHAVGDVVVCFSERVHKELARLVMKLDDLRVWDIPDIGEPGREPKSSADEPMLMEDVYWEVTRHVDALVAELRLAPASN